VHRSDAGHGACMPLALRFAASRIPSMVVPRRLPAFSLPTWRLGLGLTWAFVSYWMRTYMCPGHRRAGGTPSPAGLAVRDGFRAVWCSSTGWTDHLAGRVRRQPGVPPIWRPGPSSSLVVRGRHRWNLHRRRCVRSGRPTAPVIVGAAVFGLLFIPLLALVALHHRVLPAGVSRDDTAAPDHQSGTVSRFAEG
jgi:hypothetical protein